MLTQENFVMEKHFVAHCNHWEQKLLVLSFHTHQMIALQSLQIKTIKKFC